MPLQLATFPRKQPATAEARQWDSEALRDMPRTLLIKSLVGLCTYMGLLVLAL